jgi:hypothetical protein
MAKQIGLLIVHGIGRQKPGQLTQVIAQQLLEEPCFHNEPNDEESEELPKGERCTRKVAVDGANVIVREANWSELSDPDNPLEVRLVPYVITGYLRTLATALGWWRLKELLSKVKSQKRLRRKFFFRTLMACVLFVGALLITWNIRNFDTPIDKTTSVLTLVMDIALAIFGATFMVGLILYPPYYAVFSMKKKLHWIDARAVLIRCILATCLWVAMWFIGVLRVILGLIYGLYLPLFLLVIIVFAGLNYVAWGAAFIINFIARAVEMVHLNWISRWVLRTGWICLVMPVYAFMQTAKATANLISVGMSGASWKSKYAALASIPGIFLAFVALLLLSEVLIISAISPVYVVSAIADAAGDDPELTLGFGEKIFVSTFFLAIFLIVAKLLLGVIDLILDVANYHLASRHERGEIQRVLEEGVNDLVAAGCQQIHILAHSLGTVIAIDLLQSGRLLKFPITSLTTIGSPLDKFWYIDRTHTRSGNDVEVVHQPNVYWTNFWAGSDIVSGALNHFELVDGKVRNIRLKWLGPLFVSHVLYWKNKVVINEVRAQISA